MGTVSCSSLLAALCIHLKKPSPSKFMRVIAASQEDELVPGLGHTPLIRVLMNEVWLLMDAHHPITGYASLVSTASGFRCAFGPTFTSDCLIFD